MKQNPVLRFSALAILTLGLIGANKAAPVSSKPALTPDPTAVPFTRPLPAIPNIAPNGGAIVTPETLNIPLDVAGTSIPLTICNSTYREESYTLKAAAPERILEGQATPDSDHHDIQATLDTPELTLRPGETRVVKLTLVNPMRALRAGRYRMVVSAEGSHGSRGRSVIVGKAPTAVAVTALDPVLDGGAIKSGVISIMGRFNIEANTSKVQLHIAVTNLYLNDDRSELVTPSIPLNVATGLQIASVGGNFTPTTLEFRGRNTTINGYLASNSDTLTVTDRQNQGLHDTLCVTAQWLQNELTKPVGSYHARIRVTALVLPDD